MEEIQPFHVMDLLARARALEAQGRSIIHMEVGEPDFDTPMPIRAAAQRALERGLTHYTQAVGTTELREAIAQFYLTENGVTVAPERIIVTPGASGALLLALGVLVNPGERILMADPGYPCNRNFVRLLEGRTTAVPVDAGTAYQLTPELLASHWTDDTVGALVATPSNPTGTLIPLTQLEQMARFVARRGGALLVDEIYHGLVYEGDSRSVLTLTDEVFVINSFSKYFCMTGWRLGWLVAPQQYVYAVDKLAQNLFISPPTISQHAALAAFEPPTRAMLDAQRADFKRRRDYLLPALRELGFGIPVTPQGAFYLYADCSRFTTDSYAFALDVLDKAGVAITPGKDFGVNAPERHVRFSYTTSLENLKEGVERLRKYLHSR
jgi:aspartate/methionine/tyrosine aminotransferase